MMSLQFNIRVLNEKIYKRKNYLCIMNSNIKFLKHEIQKIKFIFVAIAICFFVNNMPIFFCVNCEISNVTTLGIE